MESSLLLQEDLLRDLQETGVYDLAAAIGIVTSSGELKPLQGGWSPPGGASPGAPVPGGSPQLLPRVGAAVTSPGAVHPPGSGGGEPLLPQPPFPQQQQPFQQQKPPLQQQQAPIPQQQQPARELMDAEELAAADGAVVACLQAAVEASLMAQMARAKIAELSSQQDRGPGAAAARETPAAPGSAAAAAAAGGGLVGAAQPLQQGAEQAQQEEQEQRRSLRPRRAAAAAAARQEQAGAGWEEEGEEAGEEGEEAPGPSTKRKRGSRRGAASTKAAQPAGKGLRHFSLKVCEKVEGRGRTTYNQVADELVKDLAGELAAGASEVGTAAIDERNIRRRVYDALNVVMALGIIRKEKREIVWCGWPQGLTANSTHLEAAERARLVARVEDKAARLEELIAQQSSLSGLIHANHDTPLSALQAWQEQGLEVPSPLQLPFMLIQAPGEADVDVTISEDSRVAHLDFHSHPFQIFNDEAVLRMLRLDLPPDQLLQRFGSNDGDTGGGGSSSRDPGGEGRAARAPGGRGAAAHAGHLPPHAGMPHAGGGEGSDPCGCAEWRCLSAGRAALPGGRLPVAGGGPPAIPAGFGAAGLDAASLLPPHQQDRQRQQQHHHHQRQQQQQQQQDHRHHQQQQQQPGWELEPMFPHLLGADCSLPPNPWLPTPPSASMPQQQKQQQQQQQQQHHHHHQQQPGAGQEWPALAPLGSSSPFLPPPGQLH